jgi:hypothetical protein
MGRSPQSCGCQHGRVQRLIVNGRQSRPRSSSIISNAGGVFELASPDGSLVTIRAM